MTGEISKKSSLIHIHFYLLKLTGTITNFYEDVDIFFPLISHSGYLIVSPLSPGYFNLTYNVNSLF